MSLQRFLDAQEGVIETAFAELAAGEKRSHWMWFVFPQIAGLGHSPKARRYAIRDLEEAAAYAAHPVLGPRLRHAGALMLGHRGREPDRILGGIDALKLRSSATLFAALPAPDPIYDALLAAFYDGSRCQRTLALLDRR